MISANVLHAGPNFNKKGARAAKRASLSGNVSDLGVLADKFREHQLLTSQGELYYGKSDAKLSSAHSKTYKMIHKAVTEDRMDEEVARDQINKLLTVGESYLAAGDKADMSETKSQITKIQESVKKQVIEKAPAGMMTPKVNKIQFNTEAVLRFGEASGRLSKGDVNTIRRYLDSLERKEDSYKSSGTLSDKNHAKLLEQARETWRDTIEKFS